MKALVLAAALALGVSGAAFAACGDGHGDKPCACKPHGKGGDHHGKKHGGCHDGGEHAKPAGDDMDCCGKGMKKHHGADGHTKSEGGRPGRAF